MTIIPYDNENELIPVLSQLFRLRPLNAELLEACEDIASVDMQFVEANGGYYEAINQIIGKARLVISKAKKEATDGIL